MAIDDKPRDGSVNSPNNNDGQHHGPGFIWTEGLDRIEVGMSGFIWTEGLDRIEWGGDVDGS